MIDLGLKMIFYLNYCSQCLIWLFAFGLWQLAKNAHLLKANS